EIRTAKETVEKYKPDIILMDGSIIPHYQDRPAKGSKIFDSYKEIISLYKEFYETCGKNGTILAGVVEDSRGIRFCNIIRRDMLSKITDSSVPELVKTLERTRDTGLLYWILSEGERTDVFRYSDTPEEHSVLRDFGEYAEHVNSFYLKTARFDRPIRIDFLGTPDIVEKISSVVLSISGHHSGYGIPSILIEADQVAKLSEEDIENLYSRIISLTGSVPGIMRMRRDMRPF
ncbi:MAG: DNA double-strand break repair nuclease NurA, partial [Candidatus Aenigmarchaeota archaeon]|nr:DNA double-strand break repair nuclease NurA [Candidatus Aenigmarchaeota archaeon]